MNASELAAQIRSGDRTAAEVTESALSRIESLNGEINAFTLVDAQGARARAKALDERISRGEAPGLLAGLPISIKDNICTNGIATTCGSRMLEGWVPPYSANAVTRLEEAGAIVVGKTNMDEYGMGSSTENTIFGATRNPVDPTKVAGGSSGGSAASVASGMVSLSLGSDTGGSTRQPAAFCGVVGMKPTYGRVSRYGLVALASSLDQIGPITTTVADAALVLQAIAGHDPADSTSANRPVPSFSHDLDSGVSALRVGIPRQLLGGEIDPEIMARTRAAAEVLEAAGASVEEVSVPSWSLGVSVYQFLMSAEASSNLARFDGVRYGLRVEGATSAEMMSASRSVGFGAEVKRRLLLGTYVLSAGHYEDYYQKAQQARTLIINESNEVFKTFDVVLSPTTPEVAFDLGGAREPLDRYRADMCTVIANLTGGPAVSIPFGANRAGLPIGVQLMAQSYDEHTMLKAARVLEAANE